MKPKEITFVIEDDVSGGYTCRALGYSIFTEGDSWEQVQQNIRDAVRCHFDENEVPSLIHLHYIRDEVIAL